ncbi:hypothetical protein [Chengkuizengella sediminis]|uniref:hypothetical protein n=1 Tax=Chengkuizengella sediminis TaxID=1885917 RepID=UPI0014792E63|nr:hypothetical protein [Chengkuizengella sediminis]
MSRKLTKQSTILLVISGILLSSSIFFPWWGMKFIAPQYPEGLNIIVYPYKMQGEIEIINGLNHYIGMKPFSEESFPELKYLPYIIGGMSLLIFLTAILRSKKLLLILILLFTVGGLLGLYDIHRWLVDFGTDLDPSAPIELDPFVPPILGENRIANFITHSYFSYGSFLIGITFVLMVFSLWRVRKK